MKDSYIVFCDEYLLNGMNATKAYLVAYPKSSEDTARRAASALMTKLDIINYIKEKQELTSISKGITKEEIIQDLIDIKNANKKDRPSIATKAIEVINKMQGYNAVEKQEIKLQGDVQWNETKTYKKDV